MKSYKRFYKCLLYITILVLYPHYVFRYTHMYVCLCVYVSESTPLKQFSYNLYYGVCLHGVRLNITHPVHLNRSISY